MNDVPEGVLQECLDLMERGESIEQIIARYPEMAAGLRPFLETAVQLAGLAPQPSLAAKQKSQKAFLTHAQSLKVTPVQPSRWYRLRQVLLPLASLALVLILFTITAVSVSASAIPGDALYSVKRLVETVRLNQANDPETAVALMEANRQERVREVQTLLRTGRSADVEFKGTIEAMQTTQWTVATINVTLDDQTFIDGKPQLGELARVNGRTAKGAFIANTIQILTGSTTPVGPTPTPSPLPTLTATLEPTLEPTAEPTLEPSMTATRKPTSTAPVTATATITPSPTATHTPTLVPTAVSYPAPTSPPPANDNDGNSNDGNDNDGNSNHNGENENDNNGNDNEHNDNKNANDDDDD